MFARHMLVSHYGACEFGSPKLPQNLEAVILHSLDELDGGIQAKQDLLEKAQGSNWTVFHRACGRIFIAPNGDLVSVAERLMGGNET
jgi:3'-5' exoribonuclease